MKRKARSKTYRRKKLVEVIIFHLLDVEAALASNRVPSLGILATHLHTALQPGPVG